jgi:multidrug efflux system outer membrane protein
VESLRNAAFKFGICITIVLNYSFAGAAPREISLSYSYGWTPPAAVVVNKPAPIKSHSRRRKPVVAAVNDPDAIQVTPEFLRRNLLSSNYPIMMELNAVNVAKQHVNQARANLLPSINLGLMLGGPTSFLLASVQLLLPFLLPSNWFNLSAQDHLLEAEGTAYYLLELNAYAAAYTLLNTISGDIALKAVYDQQLNDQIAIQNIVSDQVKIGNAAPSDYAQAAAQTDLTALLGSQIEELIIQEKASLREMLAMPMFVHIVIPNISVPKPLAEGHPAGDFLDVALKKSPEMRQVHLLIQAAQAGVKAAAFSFLGQISMSDGARGARSAAFSFRGQAAADVDLGFGIIPSVNVAQLQVSQLRLRQGEIDLQEAQLLESNVGSAAQASLQYERAVRAEAGLLTAYEAELDRYQIGAIGIQTLLIDRANVTQASVAKLKALIDLNNLRINLHRIFLADQFEPIHDCVLKGETSNSPFKWISDIFDSTPDVSIDQLCRQAAALN